MNFFSRILPVFYLGLVPLFFNSPALALDSDKNAPVAIIADTTSIDFRTGKRILTGNVDVTQGSMNIKAAKIVLVYDGDNINTVTAYGNPVKFKQLPEGHTKKVHGEGKKLVFENTKNLITLTKGAKIKQGKNVITGKIIYYNTKTSKMTVKSKAAGTKTKAGSSQQTTSKSSATKTSTGRTRVIIQPGALDKK